MPVKQRGEYFAILDLALPGLFGSYESFRQRVRARPEILERARPFVLRRRKAEILAELPPKVESEVLLDLDDLQRDRYAAAVAEVRTEVLAAYEGMPAQQAGIAALAALLRLRQICISPALLDPALADRPSPKMEYLAGKLRELRDEGEAALVFSQFTRALDVLGAFLQAEGLAFLRMDGGTPIASRKELVRAFQEGRAAGVFLIGLRTGGAGLNLTRASHVFHLDPWWNPAVENQASDRAHRIGQRGTVLVHRLLMRETVEQKMMELKRRKEALFEQILAGGAVGDGGVRLTRDDFRFLTGG